MSATLPVWDRLTAGARRLRVEIPQRLRLARAHLVDGALAETDAAADGGADGAIVFDAWRSGSGYRLWAARIAEERVATFDVAATSLRLTRPDSALLQLLEVDPRRPSADVELSGVAAAAPIEPGLVCSCRAVGEDAVVRAIVAGWWSAEAVKRRTRLAFGECQGRRCLPALAGRLELDADDPLARVTPRPPLVPVPASILAAFAETRP